MLFSSPDIRHLSSWDIKPPLARSKSWRTGLMLGQVWFNLASSNVAHASVVLCYAAVQVFGAAGVHRRRDQGAVPEVHWLDLRAHPLLAVRHDLHRHQRGKLSPGDHCLWEYHQGTEGRCWGVPLTVLNTWQDGGSDPLNRFCEMSLSLLLTEQAPLVHCFSSGFIFVLSLVVCLLFVIIHINDVRDSICLTFACLFVYLSYLQNAFLKVGSFILPSSFIHYPEILSG